MLNLLDVAITGVPSVDTVNASDLSSKILGLISQFSLIGGAFWAIWGVIVLAGALKDKNGPGLQSGVWQIVGGALIIVAALMFNSVVTISK